MKRHVHALILAIGDVIWVLAGFVMASIIVSGLYQNEWSQTTVGQLIANAAVYAIAVGLVVAPYWYKKKSHRLLQLLGFLRRPGLTTLWLPVVFWGGYMLASITASVIALYLPWVDVDQPQDVGFTDITQPLEYLLAFIALVILPPIAEEILFRGYLFGRLRTYTGFWTTTTIVSVLFGAIHGQWNVAIDTFILSLFLCYLREKTGSLWPSIVLHGIKNGLAYFLLFIAPLLGYQLV